MRGWILGHPEFEARVAESLGVADVAPVHHAPVQEVSHEVELLPGAGPLLTGEGSDEPHAAPASVAGEELVLLGDEDGKAGEVKEGGVAVPALQHRVVGALVLRRVGEVVVDELPPLHHHQIELVVGGAQPLMDPGGDKAGVGERNVAED